MLSYIVRSSVTHQKRALSSIPVIDLAPIRERDFDAQASRVMALQIKEALSSIGFMYVRGTGIDDIQSRKLLSTAESFFSLSGSDKKSASMDQTTYKGYYKYIGVGTQYETFAEDDVLVQASNFDSNIIEAFQTGIEPDSTQARVAYYEKRKTPNSMRDVTRNKWPKSNQRVHQDILEGMEKINRAAFLTLNAISLSLGLDENHLAQLHDKHDWSYEMKKYHGLKMYSIDENKVPLFQRDVQLKALQKMREDKRAKVLRVRTHTDLSSITLLIHSDAQSLEIYHQGTWIPAPKIEDAILVNTGNVMEMWTGGKYKSTQHRVVSVVESNIDGSAFCCQDRSSFVCFVMPNWEAPLLPLSGDASINIHDDYDMFGDVVPIQQ